MILVLGNSPKKIPLKDLNDSVFYKQKKMFSDIDYAKSKDLQREIQKGNLIILEQKPDKNGNFNVSTGEGSLDMGSKPADNSRIDVLLEKIKNLEDMIRDSRVITPAADTTTAAVSSKISDIEKQLSGGASEASLSALLDAVKKLEDKFSSSIKNNELLEKLEALINRTPVTVEKAAEKEQTRPEEVYVPSVVVEDANAHIKLNIRTIDTGNAVDDSLKKLKELKEKQ